MARRRYAPDRRWVLWPEAVELVERRLGEPLREDHQLGLDVGVVVDRIVRLARHPHRGLRAGLEDVIPALERARAGDHEVAPLGAGRGVAVTPATAGPGQHPSPAERHLLCP